MIFLWDNIYGFIAHTVINVLSFLIDRKWQLAAPQFSRCPAGSHTETPWTRSVVENKMLFKTYDQSDQTLKSKCISCEWSKLIISPKCSFIFLPYFWCLFLKPLNTFHPFVQTFWNEEWLRRTFGLSLIYGRLYLKQWKHIYQVCWNPGTRRQYVISKKKEHLTYTLCRFSIKVIVSKQFFGWLMTCTGGQWQPCHLHSVHAWPVIGPCMVPVQGQGRERRHSPLLEFSES